MSNLPNNDSDWPVSMYSVKHGRDAAPCTVPQRISLGVIHKQITFIAILTSDGVFAVRTVGAFNNLSLHQRIALKMSQM